MAVLKVSIAKAGQSIEIDSSMIDGLAPEVFEAVIIEGLTAILNKRMTSKSVGAVTKLEGEEKLKAQAAAMKIANDNLEKLLINGDTGKKKAASASKVPGVVMTEARRLAKVFLKNSYRAAGGKPAQVEAPVWTKAANELIASDPSYLEEATRNIKAREAIPEDANDSAKASAVAKAAALVASLGITESPKLKAKAETEKAQRKTQLSAKQAGKVKHVPPARQDRQDRHTQH